MNTCLVSVVVPVYNCKDLLPKCVESLLEQTFKRMEIILVDDGSTDGSGALCDVFGEKAHWIRVIHKINSGSSAARKTGLEQACGEYVLFVDADDWVDPDYVESFVAAQEAYGADAVLGTFRGYADGVYSPYEHALPIGCYNRQQCEKKIFPKMLSGGAYFHFGIVPSMCGKLFRRELALQNIGALDGGITFGEDGCFTYSVLLDCQSIAIIDAKGYIYRRNTASATHNFRPKLLLDGEKLRCFYEQLVADKKWDPGTQIQEYMAYVCYNTVSRALRAGYAHSKAGKHRLKAYISQVLPGDLFRNEKFRKVSFKTKLRYRLMQWKMLGLLKNVI